MAGEPWRGSVQIGKQTTTTAVAATRKIYWTDPTITNPRSSNRHRANNGTRDNIIAVTQGSDQVGGSASLLISADEILEPLAIGFQGGVTPTTPAGATLARLWTHKPSLTVDSATLRYHDGANAWVAAGVQVNKYTFAANANGDATLGLDLFGLSRVSGSLTGSLADRDPSFFLGWQTNVYIGAFGGDPSGFTATALAVLNYQVTIDNKLDRKYFFGNTQAAGGIVYGDFEVGAQVTFEASAAQALTQLSNWEANTPVLVRFEHLGPANEIETGFRKFVTIDVPGYWSEPDLAGNDGGTRVYQMNLISKYDSTNAYGIQIRAQSARTALY